MPFIPDPLDPRTASQSPFDDEDYRDELGEQLDEMKIPALQFLKKKKQDSSQAHVAALKNADLYNGMPPHEYHAQQAIEHAILAGNHQRDSETVGIHRGKKKYHIAAMQANLDAAQAHQDAQLYHIVHNVLNPYPNTEEQAQAQQKSFDAFAASKAAFARTATAVAKR